MGTAHCAGAAVGGQQAIRPSRAQTTHALQPLWAIMMGFAWLGRTVGTQGCSWRLRQNLPNAAVLDGVKVLQKSKPKRRLEGFKRAVHCMARLGKKTLQASFSRATHNQRWRTSATSCVSRDADPGALNMAFGFCGPHHRVPGPKEKPVTKALSLRGQWFCPLGPEHAPHSVCPQKNTARQ
jgi:hypothetical protein